VLLMGMLTPVDGQQQRQQARRRLRPLRRCATPPNFSVNGRQPLADAMAADEVLMVALLTSTCPFCIRQARTMVGLQQAYAANGTTVRMMIVNGGPRPGPGDLGVFEEIVANTPIEVVHDDDGLTIWTQVFRGNKDDIFILNSCGMLTYRLKFPFSYLGYTYVPRAISNTFSNTIANNQPMCPACTGGSSDLHDTMQGDAPSMGGHGHMRSQGRSRGSNRHHSLRRMGQSSSQGGLNRFSSQRSGRRGRGGKGSGRSLNRSRCPLDDRLCQDLRRGRHRYNRYRNRQGGMRSSNSEEHVLQMLAGDREFRAHMNPRYSLRSYPTV